MKIKSLLHPAIVTLKTFIDYINHNKYLKTIYPDSIKKLKNTAQTNRCFIIGNGPSLTISDLEKLKNETTFACNRIYGLYDRTLWRPTYYCSQDLEVLAQIKNDLPYALSNCYHSFLPYKFAKNINNIINEQNNLSLFYSPYISVYSDTGVYPEGLMPFSDDISNSIYDGLSITYAMIQIAVYMGYKEIYLLGIDHNYSLKNGIVDLQKSYAEGIKPIDMSTQNPPELQLCEISFREAKKYCKANGITIKNATRGGKLEIFDRISLEEILQND
ncbi:MAG: DUF115 domain-containing protein [Eubacterium coprostanoligenes]|uniref:6-hydroxymethylpterin diphosphokinase MptE-like protein n=1 Tax=Eubacterium coprostanoligenes TaxID=290054 RepID=UPI00235628DC|nr:6-hydroxymethylpterin diphosphokinase MptE-like protein [Eubacterium coprostanoligenes]MCI7264084.1 DUF115 domain-containing protein [Eubacterium coprostanoligenes]